MEQWPNPFRMGEPLEPDVDGPHWLRKGDLVDVYKWRAPNNGSFGIWVNVSSDRSFDHPSEVYKLGFVYEGKCLTPIEIEGILEEHRNNIISTFDVYSNTKGKK